MAIETPINCPGWRLYFYKEPYEETSEICRRIQFMEQHFRSNVASYDFLNIQRRGHFPLNANILRQDEMLREQWPTLMDDILYRPMKTLATFSIAMHTLATTASIDASPSQEISTKTHYVSKVFKPRKIYARPQGFMDERPMDVVGSLEIDQLYCVRGVVTSMGSVDAAATWLAFRCGRCKQEQAIKQNGISANLAQSREIYLYYYPFVGYQISRPHSCKREGCLAKAGFVEMRSSPFTRITPKQMIRLTEARLDVPKHIDTQPKPILNVELRHDLVDTVHLGQEILVTGILRLRPLQDQLEFDKDSSFAGQMEVFMKATTIVDAKEVNHPFTRDDIDAITAINSENDSFKLLVHSLAPEVHGFEMTKAGLLLSLLGGAGSQVHDEEEINVLLVGDPGVGKSNIIEMCSKIAQKGKLHS